MKITRIHKQGQQRFFNDSILTAAKVEQLKKEGWAIDPKPYKSEVTSKGKIYHVDKEAWEQEEEMRKRADAEEQGSEEPAKKPVRRKTAKKQEDTK